ncbi:hypothetical protein BV20DRAFT_797777 [Pilatotrama ljubarskyi]|nr:hypothetical protein BV20DRAFT_797777 [Pilatotrama ljubarskyi]
MVSRSLPCRNNHCFTPFFRLAIAFYGCSHHGHGRPYSPTSARAPPSRIFSCRIFSACAARLWSKHRNLVVRRSWAALGFARRTLLLRRSVIRRP